MNPTVTWMRKHWLRVAVHMGGLVPLVLIFWWLATDRFVIDPVKLITLRTGRLAISFLLLSLTCTPVAVVTGFKRVLRLRQPLGLWALAYTILHFLTFVGWDYRFDPALLRIGIFAQPFVLVGMGAFLLLLVLGVTSLPGLRQRMGRAWRWVQRLVYLASALAVWHIMWVRKDPWEVWRYPVLLAILLLLRIPHIRRIIVRVRRRIFARN